MGLTEPASSYPPETQEVVTVHNIYHLMTLLATTQENLYSCAETFALLDEYVEQIGEQIDRELFMPLVQRHLAACPECQEAYEILRRIVLTEQATVL